MPKYKLSPIERTAEKERKESLRNLMQGLEIKNFDDLKDVWKLMVGECLKTVLRENLMMNWATPSMTFVTKRETTVETVSPKRL